MLRTFSRSGIFVVAKRDTLDLKAAKVFRGQLVHRFSGYGETKQGFCPFVIESKPFGRFHGHSSKQRSLGREPGEGFLPKWFCCSCDFLSDRLSLGVTVCFGTRPAR